MQGGELVIRLPGRTRSPETTILRHKEVHHFFFLPFREQPIYSTRAHVFQIDPNTKKNWVPTSKHAVTVSYFYDSTRNVYRIISLDGSKAIINSTITPNMTFTKTSQKFGQWADSRANTVYGLGFSSEHHLVKFADKFAEFKEAARLAKEKSQEKMELTSTPSQESGAGEIQSPLTPESINGTDDERVTPDATPNSEPRTEPTQNALPFSHRAAPVQRCLNTAAFLRCLSQAAFCTAVLTGLEGAGLFKSPWLGVIVSGSLWEVGGWVLGGGLGSLERQRETSSEPFISTITKHWEAELAALKSNNAKLTAALLESTANVKQWKQQLAAYQEEAERLHKRVTELECMSGQTNVIKSHKTELNQTIEELESTLKTKEEETETRNKELEEQLTEVEHRLEASQLEQEAFRKNLKTLLEILDGKIFELTELRDNLAKLIECS
ncbi:hypothetical protein JZ751_001787 [Albula glossodonta]|uniref:WH1 domain-containing protein n=1 Tax=Albula glossodonta TaxID=121402 RepID=A0A8T2PUS5_9TELE|nr:hypothetical protein JZ751_001787 [Albula glossodonta]